MSSLVPVHTLASGKGRCIVFPYKPHGLSFSMKLLLIYSSRYRMKVFLRQLRCQWHLLSLTDILHRESFWRRSAGSFHFENISNRPGCWQQRADNVQPPRPWRRGVPAGPTHRWELGNGMLLPSSSPTPKKCQLPVWLNTCLLLSKRKHCSLQLSQARREWQTGRFIAIQYKGKSALHFPASFLYKCWH